MTSRRSGVTTTRTCRRAPRAIASLITVSSFATERLLVKVRPRSSQSELMCGSSSRPPERASPSICAADLKPGPATWPSTRRPALLGGYVGYSRILSHALVKPGWTDLATRPRVDFPDQDAGPGRHGQAQGTALASLVQVHAGSSGRTFQRRLPCPGCPATISGRTGPHDEDHRLRTKKSRLDPIHSAE
jgi:hypothetical protein